MSSRFAIAFIAGLALGAGVLFAAPSAALAQEPHVILVCTPTPEALNRCEAQGLRYDTLHCRCVPRGPLGVPGGGLCGLVCFDGELDAKHCRCIRR